MPDAHIPYTAVMEGQFRRARQRIEAGEAFGPLLVVIGRTDSQSYAMPLLPTHEALEAFMFTMGKRCQIMQPRACCLVADVSAGGLSLFGDSRAVAIVYRDADGLVRGQAWPYELTEGAAWWGTVAARHSDDAQWVQDQAALSQFFAGVRAQRNINTEEYERRQRRRQPAWRFRGR